MHEPFDTVTLSYPDATIQLWLDQVVVAEKVAASPSSSC